MLAGEIPGFWPGRGVGPKDGCLILWYYFRSPTVQTVATSHFSYCFTVALQTKLLDYRSIIVPRPDS